MPILRWLARLYRATFWLLLHVAIAAALFLVSAAFGASEDLEQRNGQYFFRIPAAFWLFLAVWHFVVRGVLGRPADTRGKAKPTGAEAARSALGCLAWLVPVAATYVYVGRLADWAWAGMNGTDPAHPARLAMNDVLALATRAAERPDAYLPYLVGGLIGLAVLNSFAGMALATGPIGTREVGGALERAGQAMGVRTPSQRREAVAAANAAALEAARASARARERAGRTVVDRGKGPAGVAAGAASAAAVNAAHAGAHGGASPLQRPAPGRAGSGGREDAVLGTLRWSPSEDAWWVARDSDTFPLRIDGPPEGPTTRQIDLARTVAQRSFEVLLRGSDAARAVAQARGVGLPRFTVAAAAVGRDAGVATPVTLHLRCEGDTHTDYAVRSTDGLQSFRKA